MEIYILNAHKENMHKKSFQFLTIKERLTDYLYFMYVYNFYSSSNEIFYIKF